MSIHSDVREETAGLEFSVDQAAPGISTEVIPSVLPALDVLAILLSCLAGGIGYHLLIGDPFEILPLCAVGSLASLIFVLRMNGSGHYELQESMKPSVEVREILVCWFTTGLLLALIAFLLKISATYSRGAFVMFYMLAPFALLATRSATKRALIQAANRRLLGRRDTVLIGDPIEVASLQSTDLMALCGVPQVRRFVLSQTGDASLGSPKDAEIISAASTFVRRHNCRQVLIALPWNDTKRIETVRDQIKALPVAARLVPDQSIRSLSELNTLKSAPTVVLQRAPLSETQRLMKRTTDIVVSSLALVFFLPVMALAAVAIKLDSPGPIIFRQIRKGFNGKHFLILKFRSMTVQENGPEIVQATSNDLRVTTIGRLLRSSSIDELPQLWNVLRGDMSLIGPRPHALAHDNYFESLLSDYAFRHHVKPGITGWAQCNGARGATPTIEHIEQRVKLDLWYINNWNIWLDVIIVVRTIFEVLRKRNAY
jgi:Undecaprenyl-phosphate glucose phosphotransferase